MKFAETTAGITITVQPVYLDGQSDLVHGKAVFAYFVRIENHSDETVKLLRRHWFIKNSNGKTEEVRGEGVVGRQPVIDPGKSHEYSSFSIITTLEGSMEGTYQMQRENGDLFDVRIPHFTLKAAAN